MDTDVPSDHSTMRNDCVFMATLHVLPGAIKCAVEGMATPFLTSAEQYSNSEPRRPPRTGSFECIIMIFFYFNNISTRIFSVHVLLLLLLLLFLTFSVLVANPKKLLYTVANPARGLLNREKRSKEKVWKHTPIPTPPTLLVRRK